MRSAQCGWVDLGCDLGHRRGREPSGAVPLAPWPWWAGGLEASMGVTTASVGRVASQGHGHYSGTVAAYPHALV